MTSSPSSQSSSEQPSSYQITAFNIPDLPPMTFPPLPPITNRSLYNIVTSHSSLYTYQKSSMELNPTRMIEDYEKLEHVGDALLGAMVAILLHDLFPFLGEGPATTLKASLVSNATLARISDAYKIPDKLQAHPAAIRQTRAQVKTRSSMLEAWIAGVFYCALEAAEETDPVDDEAGYEGGDEAQPEAKVSESQDGEDRVSRQEDQTGAKAAEVGGEGEKEADHSEAVEAISAGLAALPFDSATCLQVEQKSESTPNGKPAQYEAATEDITHPTTVEEPGEQVATTPEAAKATDSAITVTAAYQQLALFPNHKLKYRWLAMIALDEWLRPLFTPIAHYALAELRKERERLAALPKQKSGKQVLPPHIIAEDLTATGAAGLLNSYVMQNKAGSVQFEHAEDEKGWRVTCSLTRKDGSRLRVKRKPNHVSRTSADA